jgi:hypothetical protein
MRRKKKNEKKIETSEIMGYTNCPLLPVILYYLFSDLSSEGSMFMKKGGELGKARVGNAKLYNTSRLLPLDARLQLCPQTRRIPCVTNRAAAASDKAKSFVVSPLSKK